MEREYDGVDEPVSDWSDAADYRVDADDVEDTRADAWVGLVLFGGWDDAPGVGVGVGESRDEDWLDPVVVPV